MNERLQNRLVPALFCVGGLVLAHHEMVLRGFAFTQNDLGDTRFVHLLLEHAWRWLTGEPLHKELWSPPFFYPTQAHLAWSENMLGAAPLYFVFRIFGFEPGNAFQGWILLVGTLNFVATFWFLRRGFGFSALAASVGAALFSFSAARVNQTMHWHLFPHFFTPIAALAAYRLATQSKLDERQRVWNIALFGAAAVGQLWASIYLGWYLIFVFTIGLVIGLCWTKTREEFLGLLKNNPWTLAIVAAASIAALYPLGWRYLAVSGQFGGRPYQEILTMLPKATTWLYMGKNSWFWGDVYWSGIASWNIFRGIPMEHEQRIGFGLITTAIATAAFIWRRREQNLLFVGVLLLVLLAMTTLYADDGSSPWHFVHTYFPGAQAIRAVSRASIVYMLGIAIGAAAFIHALEQMPKLKGYAFLLAPLLVLEQGYNTPAFSKADNRRDIAEIVKAVEPGCEVMLMSPVQGYGPYWKYQLDAMWAAMEARVPTMNGYSGQNPEGWELTDTDLRSAPDEGRVQQAANHWIAAHPDLSKKHLCWARVGFNEGPSFSAEFVSQKVPASLHAGETADVEVTFKNLGPMVWPMGRGLRLGAEAPADNQLWGRNRVELPQETPMGATVTFRFPITAPNQVGQAPFQWRVVADGAQWIGPMSPVTLVEIQPAVAPAPEAQSGAPDAGP